MNCPVEMAPVRWGWVQGQEEALGRAPAQTWSAKAVGWGLASAVEMAFEAALAEALPISRVSPKMSC